MEKLVYVLWRPADADPSLARRALLDDVAPRLADTPEALGARLTIEATDGAVMRVGDGPDGGLLTATASVWLDCIDDRGWLEELLADVPATAHGYLVTESVPRGYPPDVLAAVAPGDAVPGIAITTVFDKRADIDDERFYAIWHGEHTPLTWELHPFWFYVRNSVTRSLTEGAPTIRAIVYEAVPTIDDLLDLHRFFTSDGTSDSLRANIQRVNDHMATFADVSSLQTTPTNDYPLKVVST